MINPTKSTYVEWTIWYGADSITPWADSVYIDDALYIGQIKTYSSFVVENESKHGIACDREIAVSKEILYLEGYEEYYNLNTTSEIHFYRKEDFVAAYNGFPGPSEKEKAAVDLHNILNMFHHNATLHKSCPLDPAELAKLHEYLDRNLYAEAVEFIHTRREYFEERDSVAFREMIRVYRIYRGEKDENRVVSFSPLFIKAYSLDAKGNPYVESESVYDDAAGTCTESFPGPPAYD
jgi:hypothetical protein